MNKKTKQLLIFIGLLCFFDLIAAYCVMGLGMGHLHEENGFFENLQVLLLTMTMVTFLVELFFKARRHPVFPLAGAFLCLVFILRELDVEKLDVPQILILLGSGTGRDMLMGTLGFALVLFALKEYKNLRSFFPAVAFETGSLTILAGFILLVAGGYFDKGSEAIPHYQFYEEIIEVSGYYLMFTGALLGLGRHKQ